MRNISSQKRGFRAAAIVLFTFGLAACGSDGAQGPAGSQGSAGSDGPAGAAGSAGSAGSAGAAGKAGSTGPAGAGYVAPTSAANAVYTLSNDPTANEVVVYTRAADGSLTPFNSYQTGGTGLAAGLGDQGALAFDAAHNQFFAVNPGDDSISMLALRTDGSLSLLSKVPSNGIQPISVTTSGSYVYALNAGDATHAANISGFTITAGGLLPLTGSKQPLSVDQPGAAQVQFSPDGKLLVVTEKGTNKIDTFAVTAGVAAARLTQASVGMTPYGFAFSAGNQLLVTEAFGGGAGLGAASSYTLATNGTLTAVSSSITTTQSAPCWFAVAGNHAYATNTASHTISGYTVAAGGGLTLLGTGGVSGTTGAAPIDVAVTADGGVLYALDSTDHAVSIFTIAADGSLTKKPDFVGLPEFAFGLVAR